MESYDALAVLEELAMRLRSDREQAGRSEQGRRLAIAITELEKLIAYMRVYVFQEGA